LPELRPNGFKQKYRDLALIANALQKTSLGLKNRQCSSKPCRLYFFAARRYCISTDVKINAKNTSLK